MGDRTTVTLTVLTAHAKATEALFNWEPSEGPYEQGLLTYFIFNEVTYGRLDFLDELKAAGIAYDSNWDRGSEYDAGTQSLRFTSEGVAEGNIISEGERNPPLAQLVALIDKPDELRQYILNRQKDYTVLPWDNQEEYGKLYLAIQLINPS